MEERKITSEELSSVTGGNGVDEPKAYINQDICIDCGVCESECPTMAIFYNGLHYEVNRNLCQSCGVCATVCSCNVIDIR